MPTVKVKDLKNISTPLVCRDRDDFTKYFFSLANLLTMQDDSMDKKKNIEFVIEGLQVLCHEYLALVFSGRLEPYYISFGSEKDQEDSIRLFRSAMLEATEQMIHAGVQMEEGSDGRCKINFEELKKQGDKEFGNE